MTKPMTDLDAILTIEGGVADNDEMIAAWQHLLDTGTVWHLQGAYQRTAAHLLEIGLIERKNQ